MSRAEQKQAEPQWRGTQTKAGGKVTTELTEVLASEAERGYDLEKAKRHRVKESAVRAQDSVAAKLDAAPYDDEELTDDDLCAVKDAKSDPGVSWPDAQGKRETA